MRVREYSTFIFKEDDITGTPEYYLFNKQNKYICSLDKNLISDTMYKYLMSEDDKSARQALEDYIRKSQSVILDIIQLF